MICKTHKDVYKTVAGKLNLDDDIIKSIGDFYWSDVSSRVENFSNRELYINKLGVFRFRKLASLKYLENIKRVEPMMRNLNRSEETIQITLVALEEKKKKIEVLIKDWEFVIGEYKKHKEIRNDYRNLQEQKANMGRSEE